MHWIADRADRQGKIRDNVLYAYGFKCAICGWGAFEDGRDFWSNGRYYRSNGTEIHHIVAVKDGGTDNPENLILLCPNCHKKADIGILSRSFLRNHTVEDFYAEADNWRFEARSKSAARVIDAIFAADNKSVEADHA
jgi:predicted HNH restriction endonuclease